MAQPQAKAQLRGQADQLKRVATQPGSNNAPGLPHVQALRVAHVTSVSGARVNAVLHSDQGISQSKLAAAVQVGAMLKVVSDRMEVYGIISALRILDHRARRPPPNNGWSILSC
jgi:hypothetical protein